MSKLDKLKSWRIEWMNMIIDKYGSNYAFKVVYRMPIAEPKCVVLKLRLYSKKSGKIIAESDQHYFNYFILSKIGIMIDGKLLPFNQQNLEASLIEKCMPFIKTIEVTIKKLAV